MNTFLGGWSLNAIASLQSGMPVTQATNSNAFAGFVIQRPNIVGDVNLPPDQRTLAAFSTQARLRPRLSSQLGMPLEIRCAGQRIAILILP